MKVNKMLINNAIMIILPDIIRQLTERFSRLKQDATKNFAESVEAFPLGFSSKDCDFKRSSIMELNLQNLESSNVELLQSPLRLEADHQIIKKIVEEINQETKCIKLANFQFSHARIVRALISALERGVRVECVINSDCLENDSRDGGNVFNLASTELEKALAKNQQNGFLKIEKAKTLHHKFYLFEDRQTVITGSFNCTGNSAKNCIEVDIKFSDQELLTSYNDQFADLALQAETIKLENLDAKHQERGGFEGRNFVTIAEHPTGSYCEKYCLNDPEKYPEITED